MRDLPPRSSRHTIRLTRTELVVGIVASLAAYLIVALAVWALIAYL